jgi:hypothetical protein
VLFVTELLQKLGNRHANARQPRRNRSRWSKIDLPSHTASAWQAIGHSDNAKFRTFATANPSSGGRDTCSTRFSARTTSWSSISQSRARLPWSHSRFRRLPP